MAEDKKKKITWAEDGFGHQQGRCFGGLVFVEVFWGEKGHAVRFLGGAGGAVVLKGRWPSVQEAAEAAERYAQKIAE